MRMSRHLGCGRRRRRPAAAAGSGGAGGGGGGSGGGQRTEAGAATARWHNGAPSCAAHARLHATRRLVEASAGCHKDRGLQRHACRFCGVSQVATPDGLDNHDCQQVAPPPAMRRRMPPPPACTVQPVPPGFHVVIGGGRPGDQMAAVSFARGSMGPRRSGVSASADPRAACRQQPCRVGSGLRQHPGGLGGAFGGSGSSQWQQGVHSASAAPPIRRCKAWRSGRAAGGGPQHLRSECETSNMSGLQARCRGRGHVATCPLPATRSRRRPAGGARCRSPHGPLPPAAVIPALYAILDLPTSGFAAQTCSRAPRQVRAGSRAVAAAAGPCTPALVSHLTCELAVARQAQAASALQAVTPVPRVQAACGPAGCLLL